MAAFGVVFLLFTIGLNFSLPQLHALRHQVLGLGMGQVALTPVVVGTVAWLQVWPQRRHLGSTAERLLRKQLRPVLVVKQTRSMPIAGCWCQWQLSRWSLPALTLARAAAPHAELVVLHAFEVPFEGKLRYAGVQEDTIIRYRTEAKQYALQRMRQLAADAGLDSAAVQLIVRHGDASCHIIEQEQEQDCDLIVLGKHGQNLVEELLLGSVMKHVLAESNCDVLVSTRSMD